MGRVKEWLKNEPEEDIDDYDSEPRIGMGATLDIGSDSYAFTVIDVSASGKQIVLQEDKVKLIGGSAMSEQQEYTYTPDPDGERIIASLRRNGTWKTRGKERSTVGKDLPVTLGRRTAYRDPNF